VNGNNVLVRRQPAPLQLNMLLGEGGNIGKQFASVTGCGCRLQQLGWCRLTAIKILDYWTFDVADALITNAIREGREGVQN